MILINSYDEKHFTIDGVMFAKIYQPLAQGSQGIGIYSIYDTKQRLVNSTKYTEFSIDGKTYSTQEATISAILAVTWYALSESDIEVLSNRIDNIEENQYTGVVVYETLAELPVTGTLLVSYKVSNDSTSSNNGYYHWNGSAYVKDASLVLSEIDPTNESEALSAAATDRFVNRTILPYNSRFNSDTPVTLSTAGEFAITVGTGNLYLYETNALRIENTVAANFVLANTTILDGNDGQTLYYKFYAKWISGSKKLFISAGDTAPESDYTDKVTLSSDYQLFEGSVEVGTVYADRLAFLIVGAVAEIAIKDFQVLIDEQGFGVGEQDLQQVQLQVDALNEEIFDENIVPSDSRFNEDTNIDGTNIGVFEFTLGAATVDEIAIEQEGVKIDITGTGGNVNFNDTSIISSITNGNEVHCQFKIKWLEGNDKLYFAVTTSTTGAVQIAHSTSWQIVNAKLTKGTEYPNRVAFFWAGTTGKQTVIIKDLVIDDTEIVFGEISKLKDRVDIIETQIGIEDPETESLKVSIIGDSISTASDNNAVEIEVLSSDVGGTIEAYVTKYDVDAGLTIGGYTVQSSDIGVLKTFSPDSGDIGKVVGKPLNYNALTQNQLWWGILAERKGWEILQNVSWSGASISSHEGSIEQYKTSYAWHPAQINKLQKRNDAGVYETPDLVIVYRGTNDFSHTPYAKLTSFDASETEIPSDDIVNVSDYGYKEALTLLVKTIRETYPLAEVVLCTLNVFKRVVYDHFPTRNGTNTLPEFNNAIREVANQMGCRLIEFDKDGITFENAYPTYISDSATIPTHPNATGHSKMAEKAIIDLS